MIPVTGKRYYIDYVDPKWPDASYRGEGLYTGEIEEDSDEQDLSKGFLYRFEELEADLGFTPTGLFSEEDIVEQLDK